MPGEPEPKRARRGSTGSPSASEASEEAGVDARAVLSLHFLDPVDEADGKIASTSHPLYTHQVFEDDRIEGHEGV